MRNTLLYTTLPVLLLSINSCTKNFNKKEIKGEWVVNEWTRNEIIDLRDGDTINYTKKTILVNGTTGEQLLYYPNNTVDTQDIIIHNYSYEFDKERTWNQIYDVSFISQDSNTIIEERTTITRTGTWDFLDASADDKFQKNERIALTMISQSTETTTIETPINGGTSITETEQVFADISYGYVTSIFKLTKLTKTELWLEQELFNDYAFAENPSNDITFSTLINLKLVRE